MRTTPPRPLAQKWTAEMTKTNAAYLSLAADFGRADEAANEPAHKSKVLARVRKATGAERFSPREADDTMHAYRVARADAMLAAVAAKVRA